ncbi:MAG: hypothetical protein KIT18_07585 [Burkholderiales bacterium]|nr:hypothetical protein [Burkholderiales bacterium]
MKPPGGPADMADAAWVSVETSLDTAALAEFCRDLERLYRINPYLEFRSWQPLPAGGYRVRLRNLSIGRECEYDMLPQPSSMLEFSVHYTRGLKRSTHFTVSPASHGSTLLIVDDYSGAEPERATEEADRSLHAWGVALRDYLGRERRWGWCAPWRWYMRRIWVPMKPAARRITFIILLVMLAEIAFFALVIGIYWAEHRM